MALEVPVTIDLLRQAAKKQAMKTLTGAQRPGMRAPQQPPAGADSSPACPSSPITGIIATSGAFV